MRSAFFFALSNVIVSTTLTLHFDHVPNEHYIMVGTTIMAVATSLYSIEVYTRKIYLMYKNMQAMEKKHSSILNLFPESLAIVNLKEKQFVYYNKAFDMLFNASRLGG